MINRQSVSRPNERKLFPEGIRAYGMKWSGLSGYFKIGIVMLAAFMALMV